MNEATSGNVVQRYYERDTQASRLKLGRETNSWRDEVNLGDISRVALHLTVSEFSFQTVVFSVSRRNDRISRDRGNWIAKRSIMSSSQT